MATARGHFSQRASSEFEPIWLKIKPEGWNMHPSQLGAILDVAFFCETFALHPACGESWPRKGQLQRDNHSFCGGDDETKET